MSRAISHIMENDVAQVQAISDIHLALIYLRIVVGWMCGVVEERVENGSGSYCVGKERQANPTS